VTRDEARWTTVTSGEDGFAHEVSDQVLASGAGVAGRFVAKCGRLVAPAALSSPPGRPCVLCRAPQPAPQPVGRRRRGRLWGSARAGARAATQ
jgi:hypothetical protein